MEEDNTYKPKTVIPEANYDYLFKIIIIGDPCCGKTSLLMRTTLNKANETYEMTVGVDCKAKTFNF
jgi:Ras-related protein Rab-43